LARWGGQAAAQGDPGVLAVVGDRPITYGDVLEAHFAATTSLSAATEELIRQRLLVLEGERLIGDNEHLKLGVAGEASRIVKQRARELGGEARLRELLRAEGLSFSEYRDRVRERLLREAVLSRYEWHRVGPSPDQVREYYEEHKHEFIRPREVVYREILLRYSDATTPQLARTRAQQIQARLAAGETFAALASECSQGPHAAEGGLWPAGEWGEKGPELRRTVLALSEGEHAGPIETPNGIYFFYADKVAPEHVQSFDEAQLAIQRRLEEQVREAQRERLFKELAERFYVRRYLP
jgi:peptidyl-prolyl cis-trans isomerase SurA